MLLTEIKGRRVFPQVPNLVRKDGAREGERERKTDAGREERKKKERKRECVYRDGQEEGGIYTCCFASYSINSNPLSQV